MLDNTLSAIRIFLSSRFVTFFWHNADEGATAIVDTFGQMLLLITEATIQNCSMTVQSTYIPIQVTSVKDMKNLRSVCGPGCHAVCED